MAKESPVWDIYVAGLEGIAEKRNISVEEAAQLAIEDSRAIGDRNKIPLIQAALRELTTKSRSKAKKPE